MNSYLASFRRRFNYWIQSRGFITIPPGYGWRGLPEKLLWKFFGGLLLHQRFYEAKTYFGEDAELINFLRVNPSHFIVDIGASDGMSASNTVEAFKRLGSCGLMVEASRVGLAQLSLNYVNNSGIDLIRKNLNLQMSNQWSIFTN